MEKIVERTMNASRWDIATAVCISSSLLSQEVGILHLSALLISNEVGVGVGSRFFGIDFHSATVIFHRANEDKEGLDVFRGIGAFGLCDSWFGGTFLCHLLET